jgi:mono/diheme cytochrome c family protein
MKFARIINLKTLAAAAVAAWGLSACSNAPNSPGYEFMPDMYRSPSLEYYNVHTLNGDTMMTAKKPVAGTIARDHMPATPVGMTYEQSAALKNPIVLTDAVMKDGEALYGKFCVHCHGEAGKGDGKVGLKLPGAPPAYDGALKNLPEGKIFYSMSYGKGMMGPHASLLSSEERWKLVHYVQKLQGPKAAADSAAKAPVTVAEVKKEEKK